MAILFWLNELIRFTAIFLIAIILYKWVQNTELVNDTILLRKGLIASVVCVVTLLIKLAFAKSILGSAESFSLISIVSITLAGIFGGFCLYKLQKQKFSKEQQGSTQ